MNFVKNSCFQFRWGAKNKKKKGFRKIMMMMNKAVKLN